MNKRSELAEIDVGFYEPLLHHSQFAQHNILLMYANGPSISKRKRNFNRWILDYALDFQARTQHRRALPIKFNRFYFSLSPSIRCGFFCRQSVYLIPSMETHFVCTTSQFACVLFARVALFCRQYVSGQQAILDLFGMAGWILFLVLNIPVFESVLFEMITVSKYRNGFFLVDILPLWMMSITTKCMRYKALVANGDGGGIGFANVAYSGNTRPSDWSLRRKQLSIRIDRCLGRHSLQNFRMNMKPNCL